MCTGTRSVICFFERKSFKKSRRCIRPVNRIFIKLGLEKNLLRNYPLSCSFFLCSKMGTDGPLKQRNSCAVCARGNGRYRPWTKEEASALSQISFVLLQFLPHISKEGVRKFDTRHMEHCQFSDSLLQRQTIERCPDNDRHRLRAMPPATGLVASGSDKVLKTNSDEYLWHVRICNVCAQKAPVAKTRLQSSF